MYSLHGMRESLGPRLTPGLETDHCGVFASLLIDVETGLLTKGTTCKIFKLTVHHQPTTRVANLVRTTVKNAECGVCSNPARGSSMTGLSVVVCLRCSELITYMYMYMYNWGGGCTCTCTTGVVVHAVHVHVHVQLGWWMYMYMYMYMSLCPPVLTNFLCLLSLYSLLLVYMYVHGFVCVVCLGCLSFFPTFT